MSEDFVAAMRARKAFSMGVKAGRRLEASNQWRESAILAATHGLTLSKHTDAHYQLRRHGAGAQSWAIDIWPGPCSFRVAAGKPARLELPDEWTLLDVVQAAVKTLKERKE